MWQLALLSKNPIPPMIPYFPGRDIPGWVPVGKTYGKKMKDVPYSAELRKTIFECLYEMPLNRPELLTLRSRIEEAFETVRFESPDFKGEPWDDFDPPGLEAPEWDPDAPDDDPQDPDKRTTLSVDLKKLLLTEEQLLDEITKFKEKTTDLRDLLAEVLNEEEAQVKDLRGELGDLKTRRGVVSERVRSMKAKGASTGDIEQLEKEIAQKIMPQQMVVGLCMQRARDAIVMFQASLTAYDLLPDNNDMDQIAVDYQEDTIQELLVGRGVIARLVRELAELDHPVVYVEPPQAPVPSQPNSPKNPTPPLQTQTSQTSSHTGNPPTPPHTPLKPELIAAEYISIQTSGIPSPVYEYDPKVAHIERIFVIGNFGVQGLMGHVPINTDINELRRYISWLVKEHHKPPVTVDEKDMELTLHPATDHEVPMIFGTMKLSEHGMQKDGEYTILIIDKKRIPTKAKALKNTKINIVNGKGFNMNIDLDMKISDLRQAVYKMMKKKVQTFFSVTPETMESRILLGGKQILLEDAGMTLAGYGVTNEGALTFYMEERGKVVKRLTNSWNEKQKRKYNPYS
jgi:hypothetical protein